jgi:hypothetical protein
MNSPILLDDKSLVAIYLLIDAGIALALGVAHVLTGGDLEAPSGGPGGGQRGKVPALTQRVGEFRGRKAPPAGPPGRLRPVRAFGRSRGWT